MESQFHSDANCGRCMVGWHRIENTAYVSGPFKLLLASPSHVPCLFLCLQRIDNSKELYKVLVLNELTLRQIKQDRWDI